MTVEEMTQTLTVSEMLGWSEYHASKGKPKEPDWSDAETVKEIFKL